MLLTGFLMGMITALVAVCIVLVLINHLPE